jgi:hypothetical protein
MRLDDCAPMNKISRRTLLAGAAAATTSALMCVPTRLRSSFASSSAVEPLDYLAPAIDSKFGNKVVKVTNPNNEIPGLGLTWGRVAIHRYSIDQAWNADQSLLMLFKGSRASCFWTARPTSRCSH